MSKNACKYVCISTYFLLIKLEYFDTTSKFGNWCSNGPLYSLLEPSSFSNLGEFFVKTFIFFSTIARRRVNFSW